MVAAFPSVEKVRLVNSGTEAVISAVRVARGFTGRDLIVKFDGCYHGHSDGLLVKSGSGLLTLSLPDTPGIPEEIVRSTVSLPFNDGDGLEVAIRKYPGRIAAFVLEPVMANAGVIPPKPGFLQAVRDAADRTGALLIFDEVITGFRLAYGGAQELYGVRADLTTLGKILGGGLPLSAYGGRREIMDCVAPKGPVYQAQGDLPGNAAAVACGLATLKVLKNAQTYEPLEEKGQALEQGFREIAEKYEVPLRLNRCGSMFTLFFARREVTDLASASVANTKMFARFFNLMLENGVYLSPSQFEADFISLAHSTKEMEDTLEAAERSLKTLAREFELGPYK